MPFSVKYNSGNVTGSIIKGNVALAVNDIVGPTSTTGWYNGPNFTQGTYQIVETSASGDPEVFCPQNEAELVKFAKWKGALSGVTGSSTDALKWIGTQNNLLAINEVYPNIVTNGCILNLDAGFAGSYPVNPSQVNLLYSNGVYSPSLSNLTIAITASTITPNYKFRITTPSNYINPYTDGNFRLNIPLSILVSAQPYNLSFNYQLISGSLFSMNDWCDTALFNKTDTNYGTYVYSSATGVRSTYDSTYRFMDFAIRTSSIVDIWDIQLTQNVSASLSNTGSGIAWYDVSRNNNSGSLINGMLFNPNNYMLFDGLDDRIILSSSLTLSGSFTWTVTCESNAMSGTQNRQIYLGGNTAYFEQSDYDTFFIVYSGGNLNLELPTGLLPQNRWYNITVTHKPDDTFDFYYNGAKQTLRSGGTTPVSASFNINTIGAIGGGGRYWNGSIANALVYDRLLSDSEILQNYYQSPIVTNGLTLAVDAGNLVSYERGSTTTYSLTGSATGSLLNNTGYTSSYGGAWNFDGIDDRISLNTKLNVTSSFSIEYCISIKQLPTVNQYFYIFASSAGYLGNGVYAELGPGYFSLAQLNASGSSSGISITNHQINTPYYVTITYENRVLKGYVNGVLRSTANLTFDPTNYTSDITALGSFTGGGLNAPIQMFLFKYYNKALTLDEVSQNFNAQKAKFGF
jgi:hypothetical protein